MKVLIFLFIVICGLLYLQRVRERQNEHFVGKVDTETDEEGDDMYVKNGSFADGKGIPNSIGAINGNSFIKFKNPGDSDYVLRMEGVNKDDVTKPKNGYLFKVKLLPGKTYRISAMEHIDNEYKGGIEMFRIRQSLTNGKARLFMSDGNIVSSQTVGNNKWVLRDFVFTLEPNGNETVEVTIGHKINIQAGYKYV